MKLEKDNAVVKWFKDVAQLIKQNKKIAAITGAFILLVIIGVCVSIATKNKQQNQTPEVTETPSGAQEYVITDEAMQVDAFPDVNALMRKYYDAAAADCNIEGGNDNVDINDVTALINYVLRGTW